MHLVVVLASCSLPMFDGLRSPFAVPCRTDGGWREGGKERGGSVEAELADPQGYANAIA